MKHSELNSLNEKQMKSYMEALLSMTPKEQKLLSVKLMARELDEVICKAIEEGRDGIYNVYELYAMCLESMLKREMEIADVIEKGLKTPSGDGKVVPIKKKGTDDPPTWN